MFEHEVYDEDIGSRARRGTASGHLDRSDFEARAKLAAERLSSRVSSDYASGNSILEDCYDAIKWALEEGAKAATGEAQ